MKTKVKVVQDDKAVIERPVLAKAIVDISKGFARLLNSGLNERAIIVLVHDVSHVGKPDVREVLQALKQLSNTYCR